jgi:hypothetical protein
MRFQIKNQNMEISIADFKISIPYTGKQTKKECSLKLYNELIKRQPNLKEFSEIISKKI